MESEMSQLEQDITDKFQNKACEGRVIYRFLHTYNMYTHYAYIYIKRDIDR